MKSQHGMVGNFILSSLGKACFSYSCTVMVHNMLIEYLFSPPASDVFMNAFFLLNCECLFGLLFCGYSLARWPWEKIKPGFGLSKLTVGHRGGEEESPEASPRFVTVGQLCVSETRVNRAVWSHKAALIKGVYLGLLPQFLTSSLLLLCPARLPGRLTGRATGLTRNRGRPTKRKQI